MQILRTLLVASAIASEVYGQSSALTELATQMPKCSLQCYLKALPVSSCAQNLTSECMCTNTALQAEVATCARQVCTIYELLQTKNVSSKGCGAPIRNKGEKHTIIGIAGFIIAAIAYALRLAASLGEKGRPLGWDDATMGLVLFLAIPLPVLAPMVVSNGLGQDIWTLKAEQITNLTEFYYIGEIFYVLTIGISKISVLLFYLRVFPDKRFRQTTYVIMAACAGYTIAFFFATTFQCSPVSYVWTRWDGLHKGTCNDVHAQSWTAAGASILLDIIVMILPLRQLAGLQMGLAKKIMVMSMFSVGIFVIIVSAIRLETLIHFANSQNLTWDYTEAGSWSLIEIYTSIICGCMPALRKLIVKMWPSIRSSFSASRGTGSDRSGFNSIGGGKSTFIGKNSRVTVKSSTVDESDAVPLVDMNSSVAKSGQADSKENPTNWIVRTSSFGVTEQSNASNAAVNCAVSSHSWEADAPARNKEHV